MKSITLTLPYPISANMYWRSRIVKPAGGAAFISTYVSSEAKEYKQKVINIAAAAGISAPMFGRVSIEFTLYPDRPQDYAKRMQRDGESWDDTVRCIDLDNAQKVLLDSLKDVVMDDDRWVRKIIANRAEPDGRGARLEVTVTQIIVAKPQETLFGAPA